MNSVTGAYQEVSLGLSGSVPSGVSGVSRAQRRPAEVSGVGEVSRGVLAQRITSRTAQCWSDCQLMRPRARA